LRLLRPRQEVSELAAPRTFRLATRFPTFIVAQPRTALRLLTMLTPAPLPRIGRL
jgi:hypothetical protein